MKQEFLNFVESLMKANPELTNQLMTENIQAYLNILHDVKDEKPILTENGRLVLKYLQEHLDVKAWKAKEIAEQYGMTEEQARRQGVSREHSQL